MRAAWAGVGISGFVAVLMGAAAAHWLADTLGPDDLARIEKAAHYQMLHTLAMLALLAAQLPRMRAAIGLFFAGIVLFSGSLYAYSFTHQHALVFITPLGGLSFMAGWLTLAYRGMRR